MIPEVGPYKVRGEIGRGGMGVVYHAHDPRLDRPVAIKSLPPEVFDDPIRLERLEREARALARVSHPNLAGIHGLEEHDGARYLVLEYIEGRTLAEVLDAGPLDTEQAIDLAVQIAQGLEAAHDAGVIHRDIKPGNIMVTPDGCAKVLDFGLARWDEDTSASGSTNSMSITAEAPSPPATVAGAVYGTAAYMSPEQARGRRVDRRTDVWSFGIVLYEMLAGLNPFRGETVSDSMGAVLHKDIDLARMGPDVPEHVRRVLGRCLQRDRDARYRSIGDARLDLLDPLPEPENPRRQSPSWLWGIGAAVAAAALTAAAFLTLQQTAPSLADPVRRIHTSIEAPPGTTIHDYALAPAGDRLLMRCRLIEQGSVDGAFRLHVRALDARDAAIVPESQGVQDFHFSPDGRSIFYVAASNDASRTPVMYRVQADLSGSPVELLRIPSRFWPQASGEYFCFTATGELALLDHAARTLHLFDAGTGRAIRELKLTGDIAPDTFIIPQRPLDEQRLLLHATRYQDNGFQFEVVVADLQTGETRRLIEDAWIAKPIGDDRIIFSRDDQLFVSGVDTENMELTGEIRAVEDEIRAESTWANGSFGLADNGTLAYFRGGVIGAERRIVVIDPITGEREPWSEERRRFDEGLDVTPDGSRVAVIVTGPSMLFELWVGETSDGRLRRLAALPGGDIFGPKFFPSGDHILFSSLTPAADVPGKLMVVPVDGSSPPRMVWGGWRPSSATGASDVNADGTRGLVISNASGNWQLIEIDLTRNPAEQVEPRVLLAVKQLYEAHYAPEMTDDAGAYVSYISNEAGRPEIYLRRVFENGTGPAIPITSNGAIAFAWTRHPELGHCVSVLDLEYREWNIPIRIDSAGVQIGERVEAVARNTTQLVNAVAAEDARLFAILRGEDEARPTRIEIVRGWLQTFEN